MKINLCIVSGTIAAACLTNYVYAVDVTSDQNFIGYTTYEKKLVGSAVGSTFGNTTTGWGSKDALFGGSTSTSGTTRGISGTAIFSGTVETSSTYTGAYGTARTSSTSTGNLTSTSTGGGLKNRFAVIMDGTGNVSLASGVTAQIDLNAGTLTTASAFHAEPPSLVSGTSLTTYHGFWIKGDATTGTITNNYGIKIDTLNSGTNKYGIYIQSDRAYLGGEVLGGGVTTTSAANKLVKTEADGKINVGLFPSTVLLSNGNGSGLTSLNATALASGVVGAARLPAFTGDVTSSAGTSVLEIGNNTVSNAKAADMPSNTIKGNNIGGSSDPKDLTAAEVKTLLNINQSDVAGLTATSSPTFTAVTATTITLTAPAGDILMGNYGL